MRQLEVQIRGTRVVSVLTHTLAFFGSLTADYHHWRNLLLSWGRERLVEQAAKEIILAAIPEEGEIHPQQAGIVDYSHCEIVFVTPGGVTVAISNVGYGLTRLCIAFGRDSQFAARCLIGRLYESSGGEIDIPYVEAEELVAD